MKTGFKHLLLFIFFLSLPFAAFSQNRPPDALAEYRAGNYDRAVQICRAEIDDNPANLEAHVVICWSLVRLGRPEEALRFANSGRALSRFDIRLIEIMGEIYFLQGKNNEALKHFQECASLAPEGPRKDMVYYYMGEIYIKQGKFRHADIALTTAVHFVPGNAAWWVRLAYARENAAELSKAVEAYQMALSLDPKLNDAQRGLDRIRRTTSAQ